MHSGDRGPGDPPSDGTRRGLGDAGSGSAATQVLPTPPRPATAGPAATSVMAPIVRPTTPGAGADALDAAPLACAETALQLRTSTGPADGTGTWFRLDAPRDLLWQLEAIPLALGAMPELQYQVFRPNSLGRCGPAPHLLEIESTYDAFLDRATTPPIAIEGGQTYYLRLTGPSGSSHVPVDLITQCYRD
jgi:hypothetical protein